MSNKRTAIERALRRLIRGALDAAEYDQQVIDFRAGLSRNVSPIAIYSRRMARRRMRYAYRALCAALDSESVEDALPREVVAILPPELLVKSLPAKDHEQFRRDGRARGLKGEALDRFMLREYKKRG
jgi:hypothetical protein